MPHGARPRPRRAKAARRPRRGTRGGVLLFWLDRAPARASRGSLLLLVGFYLSVPSGLVPLAPQRGAELVPSGTSAPRRRRRETTNASPSAAAAAPPPTDPRSSPAATQPHPGCSCTVSSSAVRLYEVCGTMSGAVPTGATSPVVGSLASGVSFLATSLLSDPASMPLLTVWSFIPLLVDLLSVKSIAPR